MSALLCYPGLLLSIVAPVAISTTGSKKTIVDSNSDDDATQVWAFEVTVLTLSAGTNPTAKVVFETSNDGIGWWTAVESDVQTGAGTLNQRKALPATGIGRYVRARLVLGGDVNGNCVCVCNLVSSRNFKVS